jgi:hypothetical protein
LLGLLALPACSNGTPPVSIDITAGQETAAFTQAPAVTRVQIDVTSPIDMSLKLSKSAMVGGSFDFGNIPSTEQIAVNVTGYAADGTAVMAGASMGGILLSAVASDMPVFIQRKGQWARPPSQLQCSHVGGVVTVRQNEWFAITGGRNPTGALAACNASGIDGYDMFALAGARSARALGIAPETMVSILAPPCSSDPLTLLISSQGGGYWDFVTSTTYAGCPSAFNGWADVAGGAAIAGTNGTAAGTWWVVGGTRTAGGQTRSVLEVGADGGLTEFSLNAARLGASAAWIGGLGLVVAGGSADAPGIEVLYEQALTSSSMSFKAMYVPDPVTGAAILDAGPNRLLLVGGTKDGSPAPPRIIDLSCSSMTCMPMVPTSSNLPSLANATAFQLPTGGALVVGDDEAGMTTSYLVDINTLNATAVPLREPRRGAIALPAPNGSIALVGGEHEGGSPALSIELFTP